jgi:glycogen debranching enzyme
MDFKKQAIDGINYLQTEEGYVNAGFPHFMGLFGRDSLTIAWELLDWDTSIAENTLKKLFQMQRNDGKILHEYYPVGTPLKWYNKYKGKVEWLEIGKPVYYAIDTTPLYLIVLTKYLTKIDANEEEVNNWLPSIQKALEWMDKFKTYINYYPSDIGLKTQSWRDSKEVENDYNFKPPITPVEVQGYMYLAYKEIDKLFDTTEHNERINRLKKNFNHDFWIENESFYSMVLGSNEVSSVVGHLLFTGIIDEDKVHKVVCRLFKPDLWTGYGVRTLSTKSKNYKNYSYQSGSVWVHDNWIISQGLIEAGFSGLAYIVKQSVLDACEKLGYIPEVYNVFDKKPVCLERACSPHGEAAGAVIEWLEKWQNKKK